MQLEIRISPYTVAMGKFIGKKNKTEQNSKGNATNSKDYLVGGNQHGHKKSKDKLIKVSLRFSSDLIAVSNLKSILH